MVEIVAFRNEHFGGVEALWREAFPNDAPWNAADIAIPEKLKVQPQLFLVAIDAGTVVGSVMAGYDGHRGWISRIAVLRSHSSAGLGRHLITEAEKGLAALGCVKVNLQVAASNAEVLPFYEKAGYAVEKRISMSKLLQPFSR